MRFTGNKIGSRKSQTTTYWDNYGDTIVVCGCFVSSLEQFEERVLEVHAENEYGKEYKKYIETVKYLIQGEKS